MTPTEELVTLKGCIQGGGLRTQNLLRFDPDDPAEWTEDRVAEVARLLEMYCSEVWAFRKRIIELTGRDPDDY